MYIGLVKVNEWPPFGKELLTLLTKHCLCIMSTCNSFLFKEQDFGSDCTNSCPLLTCTVKPVLSDHIKQDIFLDFQTGGCLLLHESSTRSSCRSFLHYFHSAISNHLSIVISMLPDWMVA